MGLATAISQLFPFVEYSTSFDVGIQLCKIVQSIGPINLLKCMTMLVRMELSLRIMKQVAGPSQPPMKGESVSESEPKKGV